MAYILNIETATDICSVCISNKNEVIAIKENFKDKSHAAVLTVFIDELLRENNLTVANLSAVAVSMGPGSYTGLRIGVSVAKGMAYAANIPLISVPSLQSLYLGLYSSLKNKNIEIAANTLFIPMIDARRMEVYQAIFDVNGDIVEEVSANIIGSGTFNHLLEKHKLYFFGSGADKLVSVINAKNAEFVENFNLSSSFMAALSYAKYMNGIFENTAYFEPYYLKDFITTVAKKDLLFQGMKNPL